MLGAFTISLRRVLDGVRLHDNRTLSLQCKALGHRHIVMVSG